MAAAIAAVSQKRNCYGCHASQKRIRMSAVPMALQVFFQPLSSCLAYPEFSEQCEQKDNWHYEQDQQYDWYSWQDTQQVGKTEPPQKSRQDTQQVEEPEAPLDGEGQWPPYSMWYHVAMILLVWALVEDWKLVDGSLVSTEKALQVVSSHLPNKAAQIATGTMW